MPLRATPPRARTLKIGRLERGDQSDSVDADDGKGPQDQGKRAPAGDDTELERDDAEPAVRQPHREADHGPDDAEVARERVLAPNPTGRASRDRRRWPRTPGSRHSRPAAATTATWRRWTATMMAIAPRQYRPSRTKFQPVPMSTDGRKATRRIAPPRMPRSPRARVVGVGGADSECATDRSLPCSDAAVAARSHKRAEPDADDADGFVMRPAGPELIPEELDHLIAEAGPERGRIEPQQPAVDALVTSDRRGHQPASSAHGRAAWTSRSRRRTSAPATARPVPVSR